MRKKKMFVDGMIQLYNVLLIPVLEILLVPVKPVIQFMLKK